MQTEFRDPASLTPHPKNSRLHTDEQITALGRAMLEFGFHQPVVVDEFGTILVGHARVRAAIGINLGKVPVLVAPGLSEARKRGLIIADNRLHEFGAGWDADILGDELRDLMGQGFDVSLTGFEVEEPVVQAAPDEDATPPVETLAVSRHGDLWLMGGHRLVVGDATDPESVSLALGGNDLGGSSIRLMVTDPPYGVDYEPEWRNNVFREDGSRVAARATGVVMNDDRADWSPAWKLSPAAVAYVWHAGVHAGEVERSLIAAGYRVAAQIIWDKGRHVIGRGNYHWRHEPCFFAVRKGAKDGWHGVRQGSVWEIRHGSSPTGHGTQKPVEAMRRPMLNHTKPGDAVYDPFVGVFTAGIAAQTCARRCFGIELNPLYVDCGIRRWESFTGKQAVHAQSGKTFEEISYDSVA